MLQSGRLSECIDGSRVCMSNKTQQIIADGIKVCVGTDSGAKTTPIAMMHDLVQKTQCGSEKCVLEYAHSKGIIPYALYSRELLKYKIVGPHDVSLLNNFNIDNVMEQYMNIFPHFFAHMFNMVDYAQYSIVDGYLANRPDSLATLSFNEIYAGKNVPRGSRTHSNINGEPFKCTGCIINSDSYKNSGKHWMALFADARDDKCWTVEFFNSSGNPPVPAWIDWLQRTKIEMEAILDANAAAGRTPNSKSCKVEVIRSCTKQQQYSKTECGVYSLVYVYSRLKGVPARYFDTYEVADTNMFKARGLFFTNEKFINQELIYLCGVRKFQKAFDSAKFTLDGTELTHKNIPMMLEMPCKRYKLIHLIIGNRELCAMCEFDYDRYKHLVNILWERTDE